MTGAFGPLGTSTPTPSAPVLRVADGGVIQDAVAPPPEVIRPLGRFNPADPFPVYDDLEDRLLTPSAPMTDTETHPDSTVAHILAVCAGYSYSDADTLSVMMARMGLERNRVRMIGQYVDAMSIASTAFVVQSADGRVVILCYRGTPPLNLINWFTDSDVSPSMVEFPLRGGVGHGYGLHAGFYRNTRATGYEVTQALLAAARGHPVVAAGTQELTDPRERMQVLYVTGHSLGGAMGLIQTLMLRTDRRLEIVFGRSFAATYTFGQPMVGTPELAHDVEEQGLGGSRIVRFRYGRDPIPHLPPRTTGPFEHVGNEFHSENGGWTATAPATQMRWGVQLIGAAAAAGGRNFPFLGHVPVEYQLYDHGPAQYIPALTPRGVRSEFGDHPYLPPPGHGVVGRLRQVVNGRR